MINKGNHAACPLYAIPNSCTQQKYNAITKNDQRWVGLQHASNIIVNQAHFELRGLMQTSNTILHSPDTPLHFIPDDSILSLLIKLIGFTRSAV